MAEVYAGEHVDAHLGRKVAIKVLLPEHCTNTEVVNRFMNEARALGRINHPGVVSVYDVARLADGRVCIIMEFLHGQTLHDWLRSRGPIPLADAIHVMILLADTLAAAHDQRIVHRDVKPENIFIIADHSGLRTKVLDFGVAKLAGEASLVSTSTTTRLGTAPYMSPEQFRSSRDVDHRSDMYSLGCTFFELLTGYTPFVSSNLVEFMRMHAYEPPPPLRAFAPGAPPSVDQVLMRMLAKNPDERFSSMRELKQVLEIIQSGGVPNLAAIPTQGGAMPISGGPPGGGQPRPTAITTAPRQAKADDTEAPRWGIVVAIVLITLVIAVSAAVIIGFI